MSTPVCEIGSRMIIEKSTCKNSNECRLARVGQPGSVAASPSPSPLEIWGGLECTVNRVEDQYGDQMEWNGHAQRLSDLELFAGLGIRALRYPVIWERTQPDPNVPPDWSWTDERLGWLRDHNIRPIVGLVHHGSGPRHTNLLDPAWAEKLADFARSVAERYPWIEDYTPVNEPLTTARFSGMYGHWYPHGRDEHSFAQALLNECRAVMLSMQAIRAVNPAARLVQTEDLGKTFSAPELTYQADFENERRWATFDLLCGRVDYHHRMWGHLTWAGISENELQWFLDHPSNPDIIGINHYLTSERFLDHRLKRYPGVTPGTNGRHTYVDIEAVRVSEKGAAGPGALLRETWDRFQIPIAVTEAHLGCTREEQVRWLLEVWTAAKDARESGVDVQAVTAWSLLGAYDWNSLLTRFDGHYEPGVFDMRGSTPRPTALAHVIRDLSEGRHPIHPAFNTPGWWRRPKRFMYAPIGIEMGTPMNLASHRDQEATSPRPLLITGATGTLGRAFARLCDHRGLVHHIVTRQEMDIADPASVHGLLETIQPWAVVNTAGYVRVDDAEQEPDRCFRENTTGPTVLAAECAERNIPLLTFSSDLVFDGAKVAPYVESDSLSPLNVYGKSKAEAERAVLQIHPDALVIRTSAFFGPWDEHNFVIAALRAISAGESFAAAADSMISPTYVPDLVHASLDLLLDGEHGIWHLANPGAISWYDLAHNVSAQASLDTSHLKARPTKEFGWAADRPLYSVLGSERGVHLQPLDRALECYFRDCEMAWNYAPNTHADESQEVKVSYQGRKRRAVSDAA